MPERDSLEVDVLFVGGGPASLAGAIRLRQLAAAAGREIAVMVIEKGGEIGNHGLSGAVVDPRALHELFGELALAPGAVDLAALWRRRGVKVEGERVTFDDAAPLASVRRGIAGR